MLLLSLGTAAWFVFFWLVLFGKLFPDPAKGAVLLKAALFLACTVVPFFLYAYLLHRYFTHIRFFRFLHYPLAVATLTVGAYSSLAVLGPIIGMILGILALYPLLALLGLAFVCGAVMDVKYLKKYKAQCRAAF